MPTLYNVFHLPDIGFGTFPQKEELREFLPIAIHCGFRLVDFSDNYLNESYAQEGIALLGLADEEDYDNDQRVRMERQYTGIR